MLTSLSGDREVQDSQTEFKPKKPGKGQGLLEGDFFQRRCQVRREDGHRQEVVQASLRDC